MSVESTNHKFVLLFCLSLLSKISFFCILQKNWWGGEQRKKKQNLCFPQVWEVSFKSTLPGKASLSPSPGSSSHSLLFISFQLPPACFPPWTCIVLLSCLAALPSSLQLALCPSLLGQLMRLLGQAFPATSVLHSSCALVRPLTPLPS